MTFSVLCVILADVECTKNEKVQLLSTTHKSKTMIDDIIKKIVSEEVARQLSSLHHEEPEQVDEKLLTTAEACEFLRCSKPTLHRWKRESIIPHVRLGNNIRYKLSDLIKKTN